MLPETGPHQALLVNGQPIKQVSHFVYLGSEVPDSEAAFQQRRQKAWVVAAKLDKVAKSSASEHLKARLFRATVESVLLYAAETLAVSNTLGKKIDGAHSALLRHSMGIHWLMRVSNEELYQRADCPCGSKTVRIRRLGLYGHVMRHPSETPAGAVLHTIPTEKYRVGGHRRVTFEATVSRDLEDLGVDNPALYLDRQAWKNLLSRATL